MANNCCDTIHCNKLVTIEDMNQMLSLADLDCTNYSSAGTKTHEGCCGDIGFSGYSPTYIELTANTGNIRFQNWSASTYGTKDQDGFNVTNPSWEVSSCCAGVTNVPLSSITFDFTTFDDFKLSGFSISSCEDSGTINFEYKATRKRIECDNNNNFIENEVSSITITYDEYKSKPGAWNDIISAVTFSSSTSSSVTMSFEDFMNSGATVDGATFNKDDLFQVSFENQTITSEDCVGITASSVSSSNVNLTIHSIFKDCEKKATCNIQRAGRVEESFTFDSTNYYNNCNSNVPWDDKGQKNFGTYSGSENAALDGVEITAFLVNGEEETELDVVFMTENTVYIKKDEETYIDIVQTYYEPNKLIMFFEKNYDTSSLKFKICVKLKNTCYDNNVVCCEYCQDGTPPEGEDCCKGLISKYPSIGCGFVLAQ